MSKFCILLSVVILVSGFCVFLSHANIVRQPKGQSKVTPKSRRLQTTTQSDYFFDGSGYGESGLDPNFDDTEGGDEDDDDDDDDDYLGSGLDFKTSRTEPSSTVTPLVPTSTTTQQTTFSTSTQVTVDVEPTESPVTLEAVVQKEVVNEHKAGRSSNSTELPASTTDDTSDPRLSTLHFAPNSTTSEASSSSSTSSTPSTTPSTTASTTTSTTALPTTITTATKTTRATTSAVPPVPTSRTSHRPARRTTTTTTATTRTTTTTTRKPATRTTTSFKDDDLDGGDDDDAITDLDNNLHPTIHPGKDADAGISIDKQEEDTNELLSNLPVMYRVSNLPKLAFLSQSGVLAGIIAGSIVVLLCLVLLIMFVVYHLKRKSEPAFDRSTRSPVKAGYKKALDKDIYG